MHDSEWLLIGALCTLFLFFLAYYFSRRNEKYNLYFALGCLFTIFRTVLYRQGGFVNESGFYYEFVYRLGPLSFIWGPFIYLILTDSLFPKINKKIIERSFLGIILLISAVMIIDPSEQLSYYISDYVILACLVYASYIYFVALIKKRLYAIPLFIANIIFISGVIHDVLIGSYIINSPCGEIFGYAYLIYLFVVTVVLVQRHIATEKKRLESQLNFLHAQIQPHFLHNTINTIIAYSRTDPEQSRMLLIELSTYLRGKFKVEQDMFTLLKDEIDLIKSYLKIEKVRFQERLTVEYDIDEECNILIPCLILQPIVENAVKHGLAPKKDGGKIMISVRCVDDAVVITIKDNGVGIAADQLPDIFYGQQGGIGLSNTNERLKKYYNTEIVVHSELGKGTEFKVIIPKNRGK